MSEKSHGGVLTRLGTLGKLLVYLWKRKLWWLIPIIVVFALFTMVVICTQSSAVAPVIYTLF